MNLTTITPETFEALKRACNHNPTVVRETCHLLQVEPHQLIDLIFQNGLSFLESHLGLPKTDKEALQQYAGFWRGYVTQWNKADYHLRNDRQSWLAIDMQRTPTNKQEIHKLGVVEYMAKRKISVWSSPELITEARKELSRAAEPDHDNLAQAKSDGEYWADNQF